VKILKAFQLFEFRIFDDVICQNGMQMMGTLMKNIQTFTATVRKQCNVT
jgi:hypothetical protein